MADLHENGDQMQQDDGYNGQDMDHQNGGGDSSEIGRDDDRKLFVGGLSWETTEKELRDHFGQYGEIDSINVKTDPTTGRSRGFAFIVYKAAESIDKVVAAGDHIINNKKVDPKKAKARTGKIFVGGLIPEISDDEIRAYFAQFGNIVEMEMPFDKQKNQRKAFCFITFDSETVVNELLKTPKQTISGKEVDVKKATPKPDNAPMMNMRGGGGGRNMRGGRGGRQFQGGNWGGNYSSGGPYQSGGGSWNQGNWGSNYDNYQGGYGGPMDGYYGNYDSGYGNYGSGNYDNYGGNYGFNGYRQGGRSGSRGGGNYQGGKQRGGGRQQRHQPY
ncbi:RNA-binding protein squid isoform X1 [Chironomus tepperi]|uniref:RNA-binding protein squid isoform X1 n=1 Tax=Chironomus tepperi TaxID=113505 RepID=UPI00391F9E15